MAIQQRHKIRIRVMLFGDDGADHVRVAYRADRRRQAGRRRPRRRTTIVRIPIPPTAEPAPAPATKRTRWGSVFRTGLAIAASVATIARTLIEILRHGW